MKSFRVTYLNGKTGSQNSVVVKARSLESAKAEEQKSLELFARINPFISLVSIEAI